MMPFRYVLVWDKGQPESMTVEAYPRVKQSNKKVKPAFTIGSIKGSRAIILRAFAEEALDNYPNKSYGNVIRINFPKDDTDAVAMAYRIGLTAAVLSEAPNSGAVHKATTYILDATNEEIWFWTSKLLDKKVGKEKTVAALCIVSGARRLKNGTKSK